MNDTVEIPSQFQNLTYGSYVVNNADPSTKLNLTQNNMNRIEQNQFMEKQNNNSKTHMEMIVVCIIIFILSHFGLEFWKKNYTKSYNACTLIGMWFIPLILGLKANWLTFLSTWIVYTLATIFVVRKARQKPLHGNTPSTVYGWFLTMFRISSIVGMVGYISFFCTFFGFNMLLLISPEIAVSFSIRSISYGLYYGVLTRDFAEICSETMASTIGYYEKTGISTRQLSLNVCAICGCQLECNSEKVFTLSCGHKFHENCIRGWCIVGKKETCPYCKEKVDLKRMFPSPWQRHDVLYGNLLDWVRYLVCWQPIVVMLIHFIYYELGWTDLK